MPTALAAFTRPRGGSSSRSSRGGRGASHCPFLILLVCLLQLAARFPAALAFVVGLSGGATTSRGESSRVDSVPGYPCRRL